MEKETVTVESNGKSAQLKKMTETPVSRLIVTLSVPTVISMLVSNIYNLVDTAFVGTLGNSASGAVGVVFGFMAILQAVGFTFGQGAGSIVARKLGAAKVEEASVFTSTAFFFSFTVSFLLCIGCFIGLDPLVHFLGSTDTIAPYAKTYIGYILITAPFMVCGYTMNNILRFEGKAFYGMMGLMSGAVLNIAGDFVFMRILHMGIDGAGLSTAISQVISFFILFSAFARGKTQTKISIRKITFRIASVGDMIGTGLPSLLRQGLNSITTILLNYEARVYGDQAVAAMSIVGRIFFFVFAFSIGVGQGYQPVCGFNYGAKLFGRVKKAAFFTFCLSEVMMFVLGTAVIVSAPQLVRLFRDDVDVVTIATRALRLQAASVVFLPLCMVCEMTLQSAGKKLGALLVSILRSGLIFIPALLILARFRGLRGIQEAQAVAYSLSFIPCVIVAYFLFRGMKESPESKS